MHVCIYRIKNTINPINAKKPEEPLPDAPESGTEITARLVLLLLLVMNPSRATAAAWGQTLQQNSWGCIEAGEIWHQQQSCLRWGLVHSL